MPVDLHVANVRLAAQGGLALFDLVTYSDARLTPEMRRDERLDHVAFRLAGRLTVTAEHST